MFGRFMGGLCWAVDGLAEMANVAADSPRNDRRECSTLLVQVIFVSEAEIALGLLSRIVNVKHRART